VHAVVALALPAMEAFDLAIPSQVFADPGLPRRYEFTVCAPAPGLVRSTAGFSVHAGHVLEALASADTVVVPGYLPLDDPGELVCAALRQAAARGARMVSVCRPITAARLRSPWPGGWWWRRTATAGRPSGLSVRCPRRVRDWRPPASGRSNTWPIR
jgi:hypothetical protein